MKIAKTPEEAVVETFTHLEEHQLVGYHKASRLYVYSTEAEYVT